MEVVQLLAQAPVLGIFIWYVWNSNKAQRDERRENNDAWRQYLSERNGKLEKALERHSEAFEKLAKALENKVV